jgi:hypothetical protein
VSVSPDNRSPDNRVVWAVIADLVSSRSGDLDQRDALDRAVASAVAALPPGSGEPFAQTLGDELQATFPTLRDAVRACTLLRLLLRGHTDLRYGIGFGEVRRYDAEAIPFRQDGPAWWAAREAIEEIEQSSRARGGEAQLRTGLHVASAAEAGIDAGAASAMLGLIDVVVGSLDRSNGLVAVGEISHMKQRDIAEMAGLEQPNVARSIRTHGLRALRSALDHFPCGSIR